MPRRRENIEEVFGLQDLSSDADDNDNESEYPDEEVFPLQGISSDSDDDGYEDEYPYDEQGSSDGMQVDSDDDVEPSTSKSKQKPSKATRDIKKSSSKKNASDSEEEGETWGHSKGAYYSSNAAQIDSEDEEANELEEEEALRLQTNAREGMCDEDFGLGDVVEGEIEPLEAMYTCSFVLHTAAKHIYLGGRRSR